MDFSLEGLERMGFQGFVAVRELRAVATREWPVPGDAVDVYLAFRESTAPVSFLRVNPAGRWRGDPTLPLAELRRRWQPESGIVYVGMAGRPTAGSRNSLRTRVSAYLQFGEGSNARHSGGYPTWQLRDAERVLIAWCVVKPPRLPSAFERDLLDGHRAQFGALPFANSV